MTARRHYTRPSPTLHKSVDASRLSVTAALTWPGADRAGDKVRPDGGVYTAHQRDPVVGYEHLFLNKSRTDWVHGESRDATDIPVVIGSAIDPDTGLYGVVHKAVEIDGRPVNLPFGTTHFNPRDRLQSQMFRLVEDDTLPAVSVEIDLKTSVFKSIGRSPLEPRDAYDLDRWGLIRWVHCAEPVNEGALTLRKGLTPAWERALRIAETGRVGSEVAEPRLLKAIRARFPATKSATVTGGYVPVLEKAMPDDTTPAYVPDEAAPEPDGDERPAPANGVEAFYDHAQQLLDLVASLEESMEATDSPELIDAASKVLPKIEALAEQLKGHADKHDAKLQAKRAGKEPEDDTDETDEPADMDVDDAGVLKAMRKVFYKAIKTSRDRRISKASYDAAPVVTPVTDTPEEIEAARREADRAAKTLARARRVAG